MQEKKFGIKRQIVTDKIGCLLAVVTHKANQHDTKIGILAATFAFFIYSTIKKFRQQKSPQLMAAALLVRPLKLCYNLDNQKYQKSLSKAERLGVFNERL